jgi:cell fate regulator YaaT (PSP1 superfamily)
MTQVRVAEIQFHPWDRSYFFDPIGFDLKLGDRVVVETQIGQEVGKVIGFGEVAPHELEAALQPIMRMLTVEDLEHIKRQAEGKAEALQVAREQAGKSKLPMKLIDVVFSFDDRRMTFAFTANMRVDFRDLVKVLTTHFHRQIRLQQLGSRDVVAEMGGIGPCGRETCCSTWLTDLGNVSSDLIPLQQLEHRGADRLSGLCGRLKCCLAYESEGYRMCSAKMPAVGTFLKTKSFGSGEVINRNILTHMITLKNEKNEIHEIALGCDRVGFTGCSAEKCCSK